MFIVTRHTFLFCFVRFLSPSLSRSPTRGTIRTNHIAQGIRNAISLFSAHGAHSLPSSLYALVRAEISGCVIFFRLEFVQLLYYFIIAQENLLSRNNFKQWLSADDGKCVLFSFRFCFRDTKCSCSFEMGDEVELHLTI